MKSDVSNMIYFFILNFQNEVKNLLKRLQLELDASSIEYYNTYENILLPTLQSLLNEKNVTLSMYLWSSDCERRPYPNCMFCLTEAWKFAIKMEYVYPRPFPLLGDFLSSFDEILMPRGKEVEESKLPGRQSLYKWLLNITNDLYGGQPIETDISELASFASYEYLGSLNCPNMTLSKTTCSPTQFREKYKRLLQYVKGGSTQYLCKNIEDPCCFILTKRLFEESSAATGKYLKNIFTNQGQLNFFQIFVDNSNFWKQSNISYTLPDNLDYSNSLLEMIQICDFVPDLFSGKSISGGCKDFHPVPTPDGVCYTFNAHRTYKIYKNHSVWRNLDIETLNETDILPARMSGSSHGFYVVLNGFEASGYDFQEKLFFLFLALKK